MVIEPCISILRNQTQKKGGNGNAVQNVINVSQDCTV